RRAVRAHRTTPSGASRITSARRHSRSAAKREVEVGSSGLFLRRAGQDRLQPDRGAVSLAARREKSEKCGLVRRPCCTTETRNGKVEGNCGEPFSRRP